MAELFKVTHAMERTDEEGNVSYEWTDGKSQSVMVNLFILNIYIFFCLILFSKTLNLVVIV